MSTGYIQEPLIEGEEPDSDISYKWVNEMPQMTSLEKGIPLFKFQEHLKLRMQDMEFRVIRKITETTYHNSLLNEYSPETNKMNRYNNIIPYKHSIVSLPEMNTSDHEDDNQDGSINEQMSSHKASTYINANFINDCFNRKQVFIATQGPMKNTTTNFWRMVWYTDVKAVVMLCRIVIECDQYWPDKVGTSFQVADITVILEEETFKEQEKLTIRKIILQKEYEGEMSTKVVIQYHWLGWPDHGVPDDESYDTLEQLVQIMIQNANSDHRSLVHCSAGVGRTGTILSLVNLTMILQQYEKSLQQELLNVQNGEKPDQTQEEIRECVSQILDKQQDKYKISIFGTVRRLREQRWGMVYTNIQYGYLYKYMEQAIQKMINSF